MKAGDKGPECDTTGSEGVPSYGEKAEHWREIVDLVKCLVKCCLMHAENWDKSHNDPDYLRCCEASSATAVRCLGGLCLCDNVCENLGDTRVRKYGLRWSTRSGCGRDGRRTRDSTAV